jgi:hypothetical protein
MHLRRRVEEAILAQWSNNERILSAARSGGAAEQTIVERYEALQEVLEPIVADIVFERKCGPGPEG